MGYALFPPAAAAQNLDMLSGYASQGANITLSGPYTLEGDQYWIAKIGSKDYVVSKDSLVRDNETYRAIILAEETYRRIPVGISLFSLGSKLQLAMLWALKVAADTLATYVFPWAYSTTGLIIRPAFLLLPTDAENLAADYLEFSRDAMDFQLLAAVQSIEIGQDAKRGSQILQELKDTKDVKHAQAYLSNNLHIELAANDHLGYKLKTQEELLQKYNLISAKASSLFGRNIQALQQFPEPSEINIKDTALNSKQANSAIQAAVGARITENGTV